MATVMTICREDLHLPAADPIRLLLYKNTAAFASYGQGWRTLPIDVDNITAFTRDGTIHINLQKTGGEKWDKRIELLAHEYGHAIQAKVSGDRATSQWFSEGFASWIASQVLHALGWQEYRLALERAKIELVHDHQDLKSFRELAWRWQNLSNAPKGYVRTYVLAFFATAQLIERQGLAATMQYIKSGDFSKSFHMSYEAFAADIAGQLSSQSASTGSDATIIQKPGWKIGDHWTYAVKHTGDEPFSTKAVVHEDSFEGETSFVIRTENREIFHSKNTLERLAVMKQGALTTKRYNGSHDFSWPLTPGKRWRNSDSWVDIATNKTHRKDYTMEVVEIGNVTVPAGTFLAARVQSFDSLSGRLMWEYWYSPTTKWIVKLRDYSDIAFRDDELISYKVN
jgi:hypothetical protein